MSDLADLTFCRIQWIPWKNEVGDTLSYEFQMKLDLFIFVHTIIVHTVFVDRNEEAIVREMFPSCGDQQWK